MAGLPTSKTASEFPMQAVTLSQAAVAKSQTAVSLVINANDATSGALLNTGYVMPFDGYIVGVTMNLSSNKTAGTFTCTPTINNTAITAPTDLVAISMVNANSVKTKMIEYGKPGANFSANQRVGAKITTDGSFAPDGTADLVVQIYVVFTGAQF